MVSITLSVPDAVKNQMNEFDEINWSGFVRKCIVKKTEELVWKEKMLKQLEMERGITDWAVKLQHAGRKGRFEQLKKKGLI
ncbi:hypothetical protein HY490_02750 [Candidatus Woesearchaeota archaeon]|nr:hypothetical protein [Candidatus Woesearchaeota archaeon]